MKKIVIDPGHGGSAPGAIYRGLFEKDVNLKVGLIVADLLRDKSYEVTLTRDKDFDVSLARRCEIANLTKADIFVSIHCNADPDEDAPGMPEAKGEEIWVHDQSAEGWRLAHALQDKIDRIFPEEPFRGIMSTTSLYVLKHTNMPACLIELGFIDKSSSSETFTNEETIKKIAGLIAEGIIEYFSH